MLPVGVVSFGLKAWEFVRTRAWLGWAACGLLIFPLSCTRNSLKNAQLELEKCQQAQIAAPEAEIKQKSASNSSVRVKVTPAMTMAPDGVAANSSWPSPCGEIVVEASSGAEIERTEAPIIAALPPASHLNGLSAGLGYHAQPYAFIGLQTGKLSTVLSATSADSWGVGAGYQFWSW